MKPIKAILDVKGNVAAVSYEDGKIRYAPVRNLDVNMLAEYNLECQRVKFVHRLMTLLSCDAEYADQQWESLTDTNKGRPYDAARLCFLAHKK